MADTLLILVGLDTIFGGQTLGGQTQGGGTITIGDVVIGGGTSLPNALPRGTGVVGIPAPDFNKKPLDGFVIQPPKGVEITHIYGVPVDVLIGDSSVKSAMISIHEPGKPIILDPILDLRSPVVVVSGQVNEDGLPINDKITGWTKHGTERALDRDGGIGVSNDAIIDAVNNPVKPPVTQSGGRTLYTGENAEVVLNQDGKVVTTWSTGKGGVRID